VCRRKARAETRWAEVVSCKEEGAHREGRVEHSEICMEDWPLQAEAGTWG
jgi:hypothetical protein